MKRIHTIFAVTAVAALTDFAATTADAQRPADPPPHGRMMMQGDQRQMPMGHGGMMGRGMMGQGMMGHGVMPGKMMGRGGHMGRGHGRFGHRVRPAAHLTEADVRHHFEHRLKRRGADLLKVGEVKQKDDDTITAEIVTKKEGALVRRIEVDRHTGRVNRRPREMHR